MFGIILAILAIIFCAMAALGALYDKRPGGFIFFGLLVLLNVFILIEDVKDYKKKDEVETHVVTNVAGYQIDSTITINDADTTKTYIITYWK